MEDACFLHIGGYRKVNIYCTEMAFGQQDNDAGFCGLVLQCGWLCPEGPRPDYPDISKACYLSR